MTTISMLYPALKYGSGKYGNGMNVWHTIKQSHQIHDCRGCHGSEQMKHLEGLALLFHIDTSRQVEQSPIIKYCLLALLGSPSVH